MLRSGTMAVRGATLLAMLCLLSTFAAGRELLDADKKHSGKGKHKFNVGSLVQGESAYSAALRKDPTPLAPTAFGPYALAHRGSSGELPEHTREAHMQAIKLGADFSEADTVLTKDGELIVRHEPNLSNTTNANDIFPNRIKTYVIDFQNSTGVHAVDLTLAEVRQLRARQRLFFRDQSYNDLFKVITLREYLQIIKDAKRVVGAYVETKHQTWHDSFKLPALNGKTFSQVFIEVFEEFGYTGKLNSKQWLAKPVFLETFEVAGAKELASLTDLPVVQLLSDKDTPIPDQGTGKMTPTGGSEPGKVYGELITNKGLAGVAKYAAAIGPDKNTIAPVQPDNTVKYITNLITRAHARGLNVHPYTFRPEKIFFASKSLKTVFQEMDLYLAQAGANGLFADFIESEVAYLRLKRSGMSFGTPKLPVVNTGKNYNATLTK